MKEMGQKEFSEKLELAKGLEESILRFSDERNQENLNRIFASIEELINNGGGLLLAADPAGEKDGQQQINLKFLKTEEGKAMPRLSPMWKSRRREMKDSSPPQFYFLWRSCYRLRRTIPIPTVW